MRTVLLKNGKNDGSRAAKVLPRPISLRIKLHFAAVTVAAIPLLALGAYVWLAPAMRKRLECPLPTRKWSSLIGEVHRAFAVPGFGTAR
jgi:hypothetical protein